MKRILVVSPHPDDESVGCGGTVRRHVLAGDHVHVLFLTRGEGGGHGRPPQETAILRRAEAEGAGAILGVAELEFWEEPDGALSAEAALVSRLGERIAALAPSLIYVTHDQETHPDHQAAAQAVRLAVGGVDPDARPDVLTYEIWTPLQQVDEIIDITSVVAVKRRAIRAHASQCDVIAFDDAILGLNRYRGEMLSWPEGDYAEVFARMKV